MQVPMQKMTNRLEKSYVVNSRNLSSSLQSLKMSYLAIRKFSF
jgi:hypothetical protein